MRPVKIRLLIVIFLGLSAIIGLVYYTGIIDRVILHQYGLRVSWSFGASSTMPSAEVVAAWNKRLVKCPIFFLGIENADFHIKTIRWNGVNFAYGNGKKEIIVNYNMGTSKEPPSFKLIKDNTGQGWNDTNSRP